MWDDVCALTGAIAQTDNCQHTHTHSQWSQDLSREHQIYNSNTHNRRVLRMTICLIRLNVLLKATLPLYCIRNHHDNWQPADTANHHRVVIGCNLCTIRQTQIILAEWEGTSQIQTMDSITTVEWEYWEKMHCILDLMLEVSSVPLVRESSETAQIKMNQNLFFSVITKNVNNSMLLINQWEENAWQK